MESYFESEINQAIKENAIKPNKLKTGIVGASSRYVCANYTPKSYMMADKIQGRNTEINLADTAKAYLYAKHNMSESEYTKDEKETLRKAFLRFKLSLTDALWVDFIDGFSAAMLTGQENNFLDFSVPNDKGQIDCYKVTLTFNQFRQLVLGKAIVDDKGNYWWGLYDVFRETQIDNDLKAIFSKADNPKKRAFLYLSKIKQNEQFYFFDEAVSAVTGGVIKDSEKAKDIEENWNGYLTIRINPMYCPFEYDLKTRKAKKQSAKMDAGIFTLAGSLAIATYAAKKYRQGELDLSQFDGFSDNAKPVLDKDSTVNALTIYRYIKLCEYAFQEQKALGLEGNTKNINGETILAFSKEMAADIYSSGKSGRYSKNKAGEIASVNWASYRKPIKLMTNIFLKGAKDLGVFDMAKDNPLAGKVILPTKIVDENKDIDIGASDKRIRVIGDTLNRIGGRLK